MPSLPPLPLALALNLCFPGEPSGSPFDGQCAASVDDAQLASSVADLNALRPARLTTALAETVALDQMKVTGSLADVQMDIWWFTVGLDLVAEARAAKAAAAGEGSASTLSGPNGTATVTTDYRFGNLRI